MEDSFSSICTTHSPNWVQSLLTILLAEEEMRMVIENAREEADRMHVAGPGKPLPAPAAKAIPITDPNWEENDLGDKAGTATRRLSNSGP